MSYARVHFWIAHAWIREICSLQGLFWFWGFSYTVDLEPRLIIKLHWSKQLKCTSAQTEFLWYMVSYRRFLVQVQVPRLVYTSYSICPCSTLVDPCPIYQILRYCGIRSFQANMQNFAFCGSKLIQNPYFCKLLIKGTKMPDWKCQIFDFMWKV